MGLADRLRAGRAGRRLPRRTVRFRLTLLYGSLFLVAGAGLLAVTYLLVRSFDHFVVVSGSPAGGDHGKSLYKLAPDGTLRRVHGAHGPTPQELHRFRQLKAQATATHASDLHHLLVFSGISLAIMAVLAIGLGWVVAGRVLRPLRTMRAATQEITEHNLHQRLAVPGPSDEIKDLADTIDGLLGRLETAFHAQRRFVANASHELRTPLTLERALVEVALADPGSTPGDLRAALQDVLASNERQERLIDALLTLATSERGIEHVAPVDLAAVATRVVAGGRAAAGEQGLRLDVALAPARTAGDPDLVERLVANLVDNAVAHNRPGGHLEVVTGTGEGHATLLVANTGPIVPAAEIERLFQPYQRLPGDRTTHPDGHGLGLSIVQAIAAAHGATVEARPREAGGLTVRVRFPGPGAGASSRVAGHGDRRSALPA